MDSTRADVGGHGADVAGRVVCDRATAYPTRPLAELAAGIQAVRPEPSPNLFRS